MLKIFVISLFASCVFCEVLEEFQLCLNEEDKCNYGLFCNEICEEDEEAPDCFKKHLDVRRKLANKVIGIRLPNCEENGDYKPVQCLGSVCHCVDKHGERIEGFSSPIYKSTNKTCKCAKDRDEYQKLRLIGRYFGCDNQGNYKRTQCHGSVCFCADENGKKTSGSPTVNIGQLDQLKCE